MSEFDSRTPDINSDLIDASFSGPKFDALCADLAKTTSQLEVDVDWPRHQFERLAEAAVLGWVIPRHYGGTEISAAELTYGYIRLAESCLTTTFVLTQRNGACLRIAGIENDSLKQELLPGLCAGEMFATVGISHLTTSRQHLKKPAVAVRQKGATFVFNGTVPWVTGANAADYILTGGTCDDGKQVLAMISTKNPGVRCLPPPPLLALAASQTGSVELDNVEVDAHFVIAGPVSAVMKQGKGGGTGSLTTSALAVGTARGALSRMRSESAQRPDLVECVEALEAECSDISQDMFRALDSESVTDTGAASEAIRRRANSIVLRASQAYLASSKGAGFVVGHPAERCVREAMFFLVWSCPQPVLAAALREFACALEQ